MGSRDYCFFVYILASRSRNLYVGMTNSVVRRIAEHREQRFGAYTARYNIHRWVHYEAFQDVANAIARESELKRGTRLEKVALIESVNPTWEDLYLEFGKSIVTPAALGARAAAGEKQIPFGNDKGLVVDAPELGAVSSEKQIPFGNDKGSLAPRQEFLRLR